MADYITKIRTDKGDLPIDYNALANLPTISNPNLLINGNFQVNQRGQSVYQQANKWTYSVDRWRYIGLMTVTVNAIGTVTIAKSNNSNETYFSQTVENAKASGGYTLSFSVKSITGTMTAYTDGPTDSTLTVTKAGVYKIHSSSTVDSVVFRLDGATASVELEWVKLEVGGNATAFSPRLYAEELALCQRYAYLFAPCNHYTLSYHIFASDATSINFSLQLPVTMRAIPQLQTLRGNVSVVYNDDYSLAYTSKSIAMNVASECTAKVQAQFDVTFTKQVPIEFFAYDYLQLLFDAEIY